MTHQIFSLIGKRALITGSSMGIGFALAQGLAEAGAHVILNARNAGRLEAAREVLQDAGHDASAWAFDVTDSQAVADAVAAIEAEGPIDILINNAGMQFRHPLETFPEEQWDALFQTNVKSAFLMGKAVAQPMIARGQGKIVNIASIQSELSRPGIAPYTATKGAIRNLTRGMATDWARYGLQVNAIAPGYFKTPLNQALVDDPAFTQWLEARTPAGRWGRVDELVGAAIFLSSDASSFVNGHTLFVDGGMAASV